VKIIAAPLGPFANYFLRHFKGALQGFRELNDVVREAIFTTGCGTGNASLEPLYFALLDIGAV
jgi:hypothetical protein